MNRSRPPFIDFGHAVEQDFADGLNSYNVLALGIDGFGVSVTRLQKWWWSTA